MPNTPTDNTNLGKTTAVGIALQSEIGTYTPPTHWLKHRDGLPVIPDFVRATDNYATGFLYTNPTEISAITYEGKNETATAEARGLGMGAHALFNTSAATVAAIAAQTITLSAPATRGAIALTVTALTAALPAFTHLRFGNTHAITSAAVASGATSVPVYALLGPIANGATSTLAAGQVITPRAAENWDAFFPGRALSIVRRGTAGGLRVTDGQLSAMQLQTNGDTDALSVQYTLHGLLPEIDTLANLATPAVTAPASFNLADVAVLFDSTAPSAESVQATVGSGVTLLPATAGGGLYRRGYSRSTDGTYARGSFTLSAPDGRFKAGYTDNSRGPVVISMLRGGQYFRIISPSAEIRTYAEQTGLDRNTVTSDWEGVSPDGTPNLIIHTSFVLS